MKLSIIVPVYYNAGTLQQLYQRLTEIASSACDEHELVFVDDGSGDESYTVLRELYESDRNHIVIVKLTRNFGQVAAINAGYAYATGDVTVVISADMQDPPELIKEMIEHHKTSGYEIVIAEREAREEGLSRTLPSKFFYRMMKRYAVDNMPIGGYDYFLISETVKRIILESAEKNPFLQGQVLWPGYRPKIIKYTRQKRKVGKSRWTIWKKLKYFIDGFITYTYVPIRFISVAGLITALAGFLYALVIVILKFAGSIEIEGWAPIMVIILLLSGVQMLMLGIIGEYLWRTYDESRKRPSFIIERVLSPDA